MSRKPKKAFTLIELLTVIGIIVLLTAIIFPVYARVRVTAFRNSDIADMNAIRSALFLYKEDQGGFPKQILGYATMYDPGLFNLIPANDLYGALYPKRIDSIATVQPSQNREALDAITDAYWPNIDSFCMPPADPMDFATRCQRSGPGEIVTRLATSVPGNQDWGDTPVDGRVPAYFYNVSGYDVSRVPYQGKPELRYTLFWSGYGRSTGSLADDPRQLGYSDPPEDTVITWLSSYRDYDAANVPERNKQDIVLFLGGDARPYDSRDVYDKSWRVGDQ